MIPPTLPPVPMPASPAPGPAPATVRIDAFQPGSQQQPGNGMGQAFTNAIDGFSTRAQQMQASMRDIAGSGAPAASSTGSNSMVLAPMPTPSIGGVQPVGGAQAAQNPMALMVDSFNFAIEASLVSRAATQFTGAVSTLMKGQ